MVELHAMKKLGDRNRHITMFESEDQKERYDDYVARKKKEAEIVQKLQNIMEEAEKKREEEIYLEEREKFCEILRQEELEKNKAAQVESTPEVATSA